MLSEVSFQDYFHFIISLLDNLNELSVVFLEINENLFMIIWVDNDHTLANHLWIMALHFQGLSVNLLVLYQNIVEYNPLVNIVQHLLCISKLRSLFSRVYIYCLQDVLID